METYWRKLLHNVDDMSVSRGFWKLRKVVVLQLTGGLQDF